MSFSPLCSWSGPDHSLVDGPLVAGVGARYGATGAQVALRYVVQQALAHPTYFGGVIPRSSDPAHIASNAAIFDFSLSDDDMALLAAATQPAGAPGDCAVA